MIKPSDITIALGANKFLYEICIIHKNKFIKNVEGPQDSGSNFPKTPDS